MKKKIAFVTNVDWFFVSHRLPIALEALKRGYEVYLLANNTGKKEEIEKRGIRFVDIPFKRSGSNPFYELYCVMQLIRTYKKISPDVIHHITLKAAILGSIAAKLTRMRSVVNAISGFGYNFVEGRDGFLQKNIKVVLRTAFRSKSFSFILQNPDDLETVREFKFTSDKNIHLIKGSGIDLEKYSFSEVEKKEKLIVLFPARILYDKGVVEFIDAAKSLKQKYSETVCFVLAGDCDLGNRTGIDQETLEEMIDGEYIKWVGYQKQMYDLYKSSDIVVLPSYREGLPKSLIEACAVGRAIVTTDVPGCRECVIPEYNGFLVSARNAKSLADAIEKLVCSEQLRNEFGINSRRFAEKEFSINTVIEKHFEIYNASIQF